MREGSHPDTHGQAAAKPSFMTDEQVRLLYMQAPVSNSVIVVIALLYYAMLRPRVDSTLLSWWIVAILASALYRLFLWYSRKQKGESRSSRSWLRSYCLGCGLVGCAWSLAYPLLNATDDPVALMAVVLLAGGVISSAVPILSASIPAVILYTYPQGLVLAVSLFYLESATLLAFAVVVFLGMITLFSRNINRNILRSIRLDEENTLLIDNLQKEIGQREGLITQGTHALKVQNQALLHEIETRESVEGELRQANADREATLLAIPDLMFELDKEGRYIDIWAQDTSLLASQREVLLGHTVNEMLSVEAAGEVMAAIGKASKNGASHGQLINLQLEQGSHWFELSTSQKRLQNGTVNFLMLSRDVTEKLQMEEELLKARKLESVGVLAGGIAHDFNNILSVILGNIELAAGRCQQEGTVLSLLGDAQKATRRATKLTQQLLTFSKGGEPVKETTSLVALIRDSADFVLHGSRVTCKYIFADDLWMVKVDSGQISQVIQNMILNAMAAMPMGGTITVSCDNIEALDSKVLPDKATAGSFIRIVIQDTGTGIPQEVLNDIFDPYFSTKEEGSGLGLAICHSIISKHGGHISVKSFPGQGTSFCILLPADPTADTPPVEQKQTGKTAKATRIMLMDDDEMIRILAEAQLKALGHEAILVVNGEEAIATYLEMKKQGSPIDLVIMDLTIPGGMGGEEAAGKLKQLDPEARIIVASGYSNDPVLAHYREYGFCAAVAKPFSLMELREGIDSVLCADLR